MYLQVHDVGEGVGVIREEWEKKRSDFRYYKIYMRKQAKGCERALEEGRGIRGNTRVWSGMKHKWVGDGMK